MDHETVGLPPEAAVIAGAPGGVVSTVIVELAAEPLAVLLPLVAWPDLIATAMVPFPVKDERVTVGIEVVPFETVTVALALPDVTSATPAAVRLYAVAPL